MRGLQRRGKIYWYAKIVNGARTRISLDTEDQGEAVAKVLAMRQEPELLPINSYKHEVAAYIKEQVIRGKLSHTFSPTRESSLRQFGKAFKITSPIDITTAKVKEWYDWMRYEKSSARVSATRATRGWSNRLQCRRTGLLMERNLTDSARTEWPTCTIW